MLAGSALGLATYSTCDLWENAQPPQASDSLPANISAFLVKLFNFVYPEDLWNHVPHPRGVVDNCCETK